ncbi:MAG: polyprenyl synthetase family protein [Candidatus Margulisiibacteriota bacterium]
MRLKEIYKPIESGLRALEAVLSRAFSKNGREASKISRFAVCAPGKRLRPALVLFSSRVGGGRKRKSVDLAAAIEIIHTATLIHDDVIDRSCLRRGKLSVRAKWGSGMAVLSGDFLFSRAFELMTGLGEQKITQNLLKTAITMCEGELAGHAAVKRSSLSKNGYLALISRKTASLFAAGCESGALMGNASAAKARALKDYGHNFGMVFQLTDDYLDMDGGRNETGRVLGKAGLKKEAEKYAKLARLALKKIKHSKIKSALEDLLDFVLKRAV